MSEELEFRVTARKWRPQVFEDVTSQEFITKTLKNAVESGRVSHAYLFCGPRGVGKTTVARILAKSLNCLNRQANGNPCGVCESCKEIQNDNRNHPDVFEIDGASNRNIEDVRELKEKVKYGPIRSRYKIFIIDEVHMLTGASFNALLKTLEEPPPYVVFIFATTSPEKVPLTILGRCQKFDFKRLTVDEIKQRLIHIAKEEKIKIDDESLFFISKKGDGSMRDAQGLFDMSAAYSDNNITFEKLKEFFNLAESDVYFNISVLIKVKDGSKLLTYFNELMNKGYDMQTFLDGLTEHYRNLMIASSTGSADLILESESTKQRYLEIVRDFSEIEIVNSLKLILQTEYTFKYSSNQRTLIEALLVELIKFTDTRDISQILEDLKDIKSGSAGESIPPKTYNKQAAPVKKESSVKVNYDTPEETVSKNVETAVSAPLLPDNRVVDLSTAIGDIDSHWVSIKDRIKAEKKMWIYSIVKDSYFEVDSKSNCIIKIDESNFELLSGYKDYLADKISGYFGKPLNVSVVKYTASVSAPPEKKMDTSAEKKTGESNFDKIRNILRTDFNAKEVS
jgi:DNA polymerase-3 subunit gamma/tau